MEKIVLLTGASSGFGKVTATLLALNGYTVYGTTRKCSTEKFEFEMIEMDLTKKQSIIDCVNYIIDKHGRIDVLINNAGMGISGALELVTEEELNLQINTNLIGTIHVCSTVLPYMRKHKEGKIINVSSIAGLMGIPYQGIYSVSKFGIEAYSETLALEINKFNIKVTLVEPGDFKTNFTSKRLISEKSLQDPAYKESFTRAMKIIEKEENNGLLPIKLANKILQIVERKNPKFRYIIAKTEQKMSVYVKKIIPSKLFQKILESYYKI